MSVVLGRMIHHSIQIIESGSKHQITIGSSEDIKRVRRVAAVGSINYMY